MVFEPVERKVYASLELKDDSIGRNISSTLGNYKWGATGMCSLGDGRLYISQNGKNSGCNFCRATLTDFSSIEK